MTNFDHFNPLHDHIAHICNVQEMGFIPGHRCAPVFVLEAPSTETKLLLTALGLMLKIAVIVTVLTHCVDLPCYVLSTVRKK